MNSKNFLRWPLKRLAMIMTMVAILALLAVQFQPVLADGNTPRFAPPKSRPYGKSLGQWGVEWWRYIFSLPADINPLNDPTGANCGVQQSGHVLFLVGTAGEGPVVRHDCVVPVGTALFFPILNFAGSVPDDGATPEEVVALVDTVLAHGENVKALQVTVDGVSLANPMDYHYINTFSFTGHEDNIYENSCGGSPPGECYVGYRDSGYAEGWWAFVRPLPPGKHEIKIYAQLYVPEWDWTFTVDVTYHLTVVTPGEGGMSGPSR